MGLLIDLLQNHPLAGCYYSHSDHQVPALKSATYIHRKKGGVEKANFQAKIGGILR